MGVGVDFSVGVNLPAFIAMVDLMTVVSAPLVYADDVRCKHDTNGDFHDSNYGEDCCRSFHFP